jgi:hypothetical protein
MFSPVFGQVLEASALSWTSRMEKCLKNTPWAQGPSCPSAPVIPAGKLGILRQEGEITSIQWEMEPINNGALSWFDYETNLLTI